MSKDWIWPPLAACVGFFCAHSGLIKFLGFGILALPHEFGHAMAAWAGSMPAIPTVLFETVLFTDKPSFLFGAFYFAILVFLVMKGMREDRSILTLLGLVLSFFSLRLSLFSTDHERLHAFVLGGIFGEIVISGAFISLFFYDVSNHPSWRINRQVLLFWGFFCIFFRLQTWWDASRNLELLPLGTVWGGSEDEGGDLQRLFAEFGWRPAELGTKMLHLTLFVLSAVTIQYVVFVSKLRKSAPRGVRMDG